MGFIANFKAKRAAKRAQAIYQLELYEWERENQFKGQLIPGEEMQMDKDQGMINMKKAFPLPFKQ